VKAAALQEFLRSLGGSLVAVGVPPKSLDELRAVANALAPFADMDLEQLTDFLKRAAEFRRTGEVPAVNVPGLDVAATSARRLAESVRTLNAATDATAAEAEAHILAERHNLQTAIQTVAGQFGVGAKFTEDKKWLSGLRSKGAVSRAVEGFRKLQSQISAPESYQSDSVRASVEQLAALDAKALKAAAEQLGTSGTSTGKKFVESVLVKLTGIDNKPPKTVKKPKPPEPVATDEQVEAMVAALQAMVEKTKDPDAVPDAEINAILARVGAEFSTDQQKAIAKRVTGKGGASSKGAIDNLRADLTAVKRALESQKV
jgi:hypothetical protein